MFTTQTHAVQVGLLVNADIAQLVEQLICNQWVGSSSLSGGTMFSITYIIWYFSFLSGETQGKQNTLVMALLTLCFEG